MRWILRGVAAEPDGHDTSFCVGFALSPALSPFLVFPSLHGASVRPGRRSPRLIREFATFRVRRRGIAPSSLVNETRVVTLCLAYLRDHGRRVNSIRVKDIDAFVTGFAAGRAPPTIASACSTLRAFSRYLRATGRTRIDLASQIESPRIRSMNRPPRARPWRDVQRILAAIDRDHAPGRRDYALLLLMATFGMGVGEVLGLQLDDIEWKARVIHLRRPKTDIAVDLPFLDPVARALALYLREERPSHARSRAVFVSRHQPYQQLSGPSAIRDRIARYADRSSVQGGFLGTHPFRHSHAIRQMHIGAPIKTVGDILGHRRLSSTSVYVGCSRQVKRVVRLVL